MRTIATRLTPVIALVAAVVVLGTMPVGAQPPGPNGETTIVFSVNPAPMCEGDDVVVTTITTSDESPDQVDAGKVQIAIAIDPGNVPASCEEHTGWTDLNNPGDNPVNGEVSLSLDLDALGVIPGQTVGFQAHYVTGGGQDHVDTHDSECYNLVTMPCPEGTACTRTQGYYGNKPVVLDENDLPLIVGEGHTIELTSADAILEYLPAGKKPRQLTRSYTDPARKPGTDSGVFGGQVTALKLNVMLDPYLGSLVFNDPDSAFDGMTVAAFLDEAERVLGGGELLAGTTVGGGGNNSYNYVADQINNAFDSEPNEYGACTASDWALEYLHS